MKDWRLTCFAIRKISSYGAEAMFDDSRFKHVRSHLTNWAVRIYTGSERRGTTFLYAGNVSWIIRSIMACLEARSQPDFDLCGSNLTNKSPVQTTQWTVPKSCIGSFIVIRMFDTNSVFMTMLFERILDSVEASPVVEKVKDTFVTSTPARCGWNWLKVIPM